MNDLNHDILRSIFIKIKPSEFKLHSVSKEFLSICNDFYFVKDYVTKYQYEFKFMDLLKILSKNNNNTNWLQQFFLETVYNHIIKNKSFVPSDYNYLLNIFYFQTNDQLSNVLIEACENMHTIHIIELLLNLGANIDFEYCLSTPLIKAIRTNNAEIVEYLLQRGANANLSFNYDYDKYYYFNKYRSKIKKFSPLIISCQNGNLELVQILFSYGGDINTKDNDGNSLLTETTNISILKFLIDQGIDITIKNNYGENALSFSSLLGNMDVVNFLINSEINIDINSKDRNGDTIIGALIKRETDYTSNMPFSNVKGVENIDQLFNSIKYYLEKGVNINDGHEPPLVIATSCNTKKLDFSPLMTFLVKNGADVNGEDSKGQTSLIKAIFHYDINLCQVLIDLGADLNHHNKYNNVPLVYALQYCHNTKIIEFLLDRGANINEKGFKGKTPLMSYLWEDIIDYDIIEFLLNRGAEINVKSDAGYTPLMIISERGYLEIVELLLNRGAYVDEKSMDGDTAMMLATKYAYLEIVLLLLSRGSYIDTKNKKGETALMIAVDHGYTPIVTLLLKRCANVNISLNDGTTPLMMAIKRQYKDIVYLLLDRRADISLKNKKGESCLTLASQYLNIDKLLFRLKKY